MTTQIQLKYIYAYNQLTVILYVRTSVVATTSTISEYAFGSEYCSREKDKVS